LGQSKLREIREEDSFRQCVERLGGAYRIDRALTALMSGLAFWPEGFPLVGDHGLRIAKTEEFYDMDYKVMVPAFRLYFQIHDDGAVVLWWIERIPDEDAAFDAKAELN
jgi:hypothetical protein